MSPPARRRGVPRPGLAAPPGSHPPRADWGVAGVSVGPPRGRGWRPGAGVALCWIRQAVWIGYSTRLYGVARRAGPPSPNRHWWRSPRAGSVGPARRGGPSVALVPTTWRPSSAVAAAAGCLKTGSSRSRGRHLHTEPAGPHPLLPRATSWAVCVCSRPLRVASPDLTWGRLGARPPSGDIDHLAATARERSAPVPPNEGQPRTSGRGGEGRVSESGRALWRASTMPMLG